VPAAKTIDAMRLLAKCEGIVADPVYEGKSLVGLIELIEDGVLCRGSRPNPIGLHRVTVRAIDGGRLRVGAARGDRRNAGGGYQAGHTPATGRPSGR
jgi:hypothetical protein